MKLKPVCGPCIQRHLRDVALWVVDKVFGPCCICKNVEWTVLIKG
jgi:hypothetical protein